MMKGQAAVIYRKASVNASGTDETAVKITVIKTAGVLYYIYVACFLILSCCYCTVLCNSWLFESPRFLLVIAVCRETKKTKQDGGIQ
jgi:hypothetical protein